MRRLFVRPIKAIKDKIGGSSTYYILCSVEEAYDNNYPNALAISFLDTEVTSYPFFFTEEMAQRIIDFFRNTPPNADVFVCYDSDESRSEAIAVALMRSQGGDAKLVCNKPVIHPNRWVYFIMCKCLNLPLDD